ncbi:OPT oligopeptide transporter protein-domain-containing protein [Geranomyces variabilis]|nr:OPT oligopeptide transporter protein-domain-containing protein [Geranomyces variabilis]KAJ3142082.1 hypothetical protein HDU90_004355 [Geranomyces variabilis]
MDHRDGKLAPEASHATLNDGNNNNAHLHNNNNGLNNSTTAADGTTTATPYHNHLTAGPKEDELRKDPAYVAYEKAGIENEATEFDEDTDAVARAINSVVPHDDNPADPVTTFRSIFLGTLFGVILCLVNGVMAFRPSAVVIPPTIATLLSYPMGVFMAKVLPRGILNPGPFSMKEHVIITMIASAAGGGTSGIPYGIDNVVAQMWPGEQVEITWGQAFGWVICTQMIGFGFAGMLRRFVVWPREMVWPGNFAQLALFASYHKKDAELVGDANAQTWKMSRYTLFWIVVAGMFIWELVPLYFMTAVQAISIGCWFSKNQAANNFLGAFSGMGMTTLTLDWEYILGTWLTTPFWVAAIMLVGNLFWVWFLVPVVQFGNLMEGSRSLRASADSEVEIVNSSALFDKNGLAVSKAKLYNIGFKVNKDFVAAHEPFQISTYFYVTYAQSFFNLTAVLVHIALWYGPQIKRQVNQMRRGEGREGNDLHNRLMRAYPEVPEFVYAGIAIVFFVGMIIVGLKTAFVMPVWSVFLATGIALLFLIPIAIIQSITGMQVGLNVVTEFIIGLILPGEVITVMCFKSYGYNVMIQAMQLTSDLKLGHYLHIPPWHMLMTQIYGTAIQAIFSTTTAFWVLHNWGPKVGASGRPQFPDGSGKIGKGEWAAQSYMLFFNAGAIWGAIGPAAFFSGKFAGIYWAFLAGAICPVIPWLANKYYPSRWWIYMNFPIFSISYGSWGAGLPNNYVWTTFIVSFFFQFYLYRHKFAWWSKYNYVVAAGADCGLAVCLVFTAFFATAVPAPIWPGNPDSNWSFDWWCTNPSDGVSGEWRTPPPDAS